MGIGFVPSARSHLPGAGRGRAVGAVAALLLVGAALTLLTTRAQAEGTVDLTIDPDAAGGVDLASLSYADAKSALTGTVTLPLAVDGLPVIAVPSAALYTRDDTPSLALHGDATLLGQNVQVLLTAVWPDTKPNSTPELALAARVDGVGLDVLNPAFDLDSAPQLSRAWLVVSPGGASIAPGALPAGVTEFYPEVLTIPPTGVFLRGDVDVPSYPALGEALRFIGHGAASSLSVSGTLAGSAAVLADDATSATPGLDAMEVTVQLASGGDPVWLTGRTSTFTFSTAGISLSEELTVEVDGTENVFRGTVSVDPAVFASGGTIEVGLGLDGTLDAPFGLDAFTLSDVGLRLRLASGDAAGLAAGLTATVAAGDRSVAIEAGFAVDGDTVSAALAVEGPVTAADLVALASELGDASGLDGDGLDMLAVERAEFAFTTGTGGTTFSATADTSVDTVDLSLLLSVHLPATGSDDTAQLLVGFRADGTGDCGCLSLAELTGADLGMDLQLDDVLLLVAQGYPDTVGEEDLTAAEIAFLEPVVGSPVADLELGSSINLAGTVLLGGLPEDVRTALGLSDDAAVELRGTLGVGLGAFTGGAGSFDGLSLSAGLPAFAPPSLPSGLAFVEGWTLELAASSSGIAVSAAGDVEFDLDGTGGNDAQTVSAALSFATGSEGTTIALSGSTGAWEEPFGATWLTIDTLALDVTIASGQVDANLAGSATVDGTAGLDVTVQLAAGGGTEVRIQVAYSGGLSVGGALDLVGASITPAPDIPDELDQAGITSPQLTLQAGSGGTSVSITGGTSLPSAFGDDPLVGELLVDLEGGRFLLAVRSDEGLQLSDLVPGLPAAADLGVSDAAVVLTNRRIDIPAPELSDEAFGYFAPTFDCSGNPVDPAEDDADPCAFTLELAQGLGFQGSVGFPDGFADVAKELWVVAGSDLVITGQVPLFGSTQPVSLRAEIGEMDPPDDARPDWFDAGSLAIGIDEAGLGVVGDLTTKFRRSDDPVSDASACPGQVLPADLGSGEQDYCYDVLTFSIEAGVTTGKVKVTGKLGTDGGTWDEPFGVEWLAVDDLVLDLGLSIATASVDMGFRGAFAVADRDVDASISLGVTASPPWVLLHGVRLQSTNGLALSDLLWLQEQITGVELPTGDLPDLSVRNVLISYADLPNPDLCLRPGVFIAGDLYVGAPPPTEDDLDGVVEDPNGCSFFDSSQGASVGPQQVSTAGAEDDSLPLPPQTEACKNDEDCFASVLLEISPSGGLKGAGYLGAVALAPVYFEGAEAQLQLSPEVQQLGLSGAARIGPADPSQPQFARGMLDLRLSRSGFDLTGDVGIFGEKFRAYLEASADLPDTSEGFELSSLQQVNFAARAILRADFRNEVSAALDPAVRGLRQTVLTLDGILDAVLGGDLSGALEDLEAQLQANGLSVPAELDEALAVIGDILEVADVGADTLLNGWSGTIPGIPGEMIPEKETCVTTVKDGTCWSTPPACAGSVCVPGIPGSWVQPSCNGGLGTVVDGTCYTTPPVTTSLPGVCDAIDGLPDPCRLEHVVDELLAEPVADLFADATGVAVPDNFGVRSLLSTLAQELDGANTTLALECAEISTSFGPSDGVPAAGLGLAARLDLFGSDLGFGATWDFSVADLKGAAGAKNVTAAFEGVFDALLDIEPKSCVGFPGDAPDDAAATGVSLSASPGTVTEGGTVTATGKVLGTLTEEREVVVSWGDGSTSTVTTSGQQFSADHTYVDDGVGTTGASTFVITTTVSAEGLSATSTVTVTNAAPADATVRADTATVDEAGTVTLTGSASDAGTADTHTATIDWGDGTSSTADVTTTSGSITISASHTYVDDDPTGTPADDHTIAVTISDDDTGTATATTVVEVADVAPSAVTLAPTAIVEGVPDATAATSEQVRTTAGEVMVDEGDYVVYTGTFADVGTADTHVVTVNWGDGGAATVRLAAGERTFQVRHRYVDDDPSGTATDTYDVQVTVTDDDGLSATVTEQVSVHDVAPHSVGLAVLADRAAVGTVDEHTDVELLVGFADPGLADTFTVHIDWGAGWGEDRYQEVTLEAGARQLVVPRTYGDDGEFTIQVTVTDDDTLAGSGSTTLTVTNVDPTAAIDHTGTLEIHGVDTFLVHTGEALTLSATATDVGSDDLTFDWDLADGTDASHPRRLVAGTDDPDPSPQVSPRVVVDDMTHAWQRICLYDVTVDVTDDDTGTAPQDTIPVVVVGHETHRWGSGDWKQQFAGRGSRAAARFDDAQAGCHLAVVRHLSAVFGEDVALATADDAVAVLSPQPSEERDRLDAAILTAWLDVANGALDYLEVKALLGAAEEVRLDPTTTDRELQQHRQRLQRTGR